MTYELEIGGRTRHVTLTRAGDGFAVALDGRTWRVDVARVAEHTLSLIVDAVEEKAAGQFSQGSGPLVSAGVDVTIVSGPSAGQLTVQLGGGPVTVGVDGHRRWGRSDVAAAAGPQKVTAPMPGRIVRLFVQPGDAVTARQGLVVVEAMKMENELRAGRDGTVAEVHVREGLSVDAGALLIVIQ